MREIKFRAWNGKRILDDFCVSCRSGKAEVRGEVFDWTLMQYTGLKDKNGKEIYEGDVVKSDWYNDEQRITGARVIFTSGCFTCIGLKHKLYLYPELEVIGNIYENPELINT